jgi:hypothetical protein
MYIFGFGYLVMVYAHGFTRLHVVRRPFYLHIEIVPPLLHIFLGHTLHDTNLGENFFIH